MQMAIVFLLKMARGQEPASGLESVCIVRWHFVYRGAEAHSLTSKYTHPNVIFLYTRHTYKAHKGYSQPQVTAVFNPPRHTHNLSSLILTYPLLF